MNLVIIPLSFFLGAIFKFPGGDCTFSFIKSPHDPTVVIFGSNSSNVSLHWKCNISEPSIWTIVVHRFDPESPTSLITLAYRTGSDGENKISDANFAGRGLFFGSGCEATLLIFNVIVDDGKFRYRVKVSTHKGGDVYSDSVNMLVAVAAHNVAVKCGDAVLGQTMTCNCTADGNPAPSFQWRASNGSVIGNGNSYKMPVVERTLNGNYLICVASNEFGPEVDKNTSSFYVKVPPKITIWPERQTVCENQPVTISCNVEEGIPEPEVNWIKNSDGKILKSSHGMSSNYSNRLIKGHHSGNYSCVATNAAGTESKTASIHVKIAAKISIITRNDSYERNTPVTLECNVTGDPSPNVTWINITDGSVLHNSTTETSYHIPNVSFYHKGIYRCVAENKCGSDSRETTINVYDNPCKRSPCNNGGTCSPIIASTWVSYKCDCISTLWKGKDCNESICDGICKNDGICNRADGKCSCSGFGIGETCDNKLKETERELRLPSVRYLEDYKNIKSNASQQFALSFSREIVKESNAEDGKVIAIKKGSVIVHFVLYYNSTMSDDEIEKLLRKAVADGKIGSYEVDPYSLKQPSAPTTPGKKGLKVEIIVLIAVIASILVIVIIVVIIWKVKRRRCRRGRKVTNGEEHKLNSTFGHAPYVEDGPTVTSHQDKRSKEGKKPVPLYSEVDMPKKSKKKKPGEVLYADLDTFQPNVATEGSNAQQPSKKPEKHQTTDYASITDVIKEEGGKSVKVPIVTSDRNISNNGSTISEP